MTFDVNFWHPTSISHLPQIHSVNIANFDILPVHFRQILDQPDGDLWPIENGHGIGPTAVIDDRGGQVDGRADRVHLLVQQIEAVDAEAAVDAQELGEIGQLVVGQVLGQHCVEGLYVRHALLVPFDLVQVLGEEIFEFFNGFLVFM